MFGRIEDLQHLEGLLSRHPVAGIVGARQIGKTTLARALVDGHDGPVTLFDLEDPAHLAQLQDPMLGLKDRRGLVVIDEVQRLPDLFTVLRVLADRPDLPARFLVLGSASPDLLQQGAESLAGRIVYHQLTGFSLGDAGADELSSLWFRGGFPRSFLAANDAESNEWRQAFIQTFLDRDLPQLGVSVAAQTMRRFWTMLAHTHGQIWNASRLARSFGVSDMTVRKYVDHLTSAMVVRQLQPWYENLKKRQVKAPKVYIADSGLLHSLLGLPEREDLEGHPTVGSSWEGFLLNEVASRLGARPEECYFWATHAGAKLDLLVVHGRKRLGFEFKRTVAPRVTRSMRTAILDLGLDRLDVIHAGDETFPLAEKVRAVAATRLGSDLDPL
jgi:predicted AAA+ superfamily ATPase